MEERLELDFGHGLDNHRRVGLRQGTLDEVAPQEFAVDKGVCGFGVDGKFAGESITRLSAANESPSVGGECETYDTPTSPRNRLRSSGLRRLPGSMGGSPSSSAQHLCHG